MLDAETGGNEFVRQIIEQLRMRRAAAHPSEIIRGRDDAAAEMILPDAVHHHASSQRVFRVDYPFSQFGAGFFDGLRQLGGSLREQYAERAHADAVAFRI